MSTAQNDFSSPVPSMHDRISSLSLPLEFEFAQKRSWVFNSIKTTRTTLNNKAHSLAKP